MSKRFLTEDEIDEKIAAAVGGGGLKFESLYEFTGASSSAAFICGKRCVTSMTRESQGVYKIYHNLGTSKLHVIGQGMYNSDRSGTQNPVYVSIPDFVSTYIRVLIADDDSKNDGKFRLAFYTYS